ncbi:hypothetical protein PoB_004411400 [Plakobranchus ocellatus]|uniref:Lon N-terminal domain-containing protein n=1 Tax=Plakobranchus ocellatus TaxID=259542 RepID=A0AAV4BH02_9GAST|nr:hypothetical protein PoB_004411400 [Plakobranchus ocellatus]
MIGQSGEDGLTWTECKQFEREKSPFDDQHDVDDESAYVAHPLASSTPPPPIIALSGAVLFPYPPNPKSIRIGSLLEMPLMTSSSKVAVILPQRDLLLVSRIVLNVKNE